MKRRSLLPLLLLTILVDCSTCKQNDNKSPDVAPAASEGSETIITSQAQLEKLLDSLDKAGVNFTFTTNEADDKTGDKKVSDISDLNSLTVQSLDSLIRHTKSQNIVLHFWATWCAPCRKEFPKLLKDAASLKNTELVLISNDYDSREQRIKVMNVYNKLNTDLPKYIAKTIDKSDSQGKRTQISLLKHLGCESQGGLPFNVLIENKKVTKFSADYTAVFDELRQAGAN